jgi:L-ascorbate metabolism protein UlaG (beta-lactamase superfamily)
MADAYSQGRGEDGLVRFVGYLIRAPGIGIYHAGDTLVTDGLREALAGHAIDVALLPVNGRDYYREGAGLIGNMDAREAVRLAQELGVRVLVPMHWDLFNGNTVRPGIAVDEAAGDSGLHVLVPSRFAELPLPVFGPQ